MTSKFVSSPTKWEYCHLLEHYRLIHSRHSISVRFSRLYTGSIQYMLGFCPPSETFRAYTKHLYVAWTRVPNEGDGSLEFLCASLGESLFHFSCCPCYDYYMLCFWCSEKETGLCKHEVSAKKKNPSVSRMGRNSIKNNNNECWRKVSITRRNRSWERTFSS